MDRRCDDDNTHRGDKNKHTTQLISECSLKHARLRSDIDQLSVQMLTIHTNNTNLRCWAQHMGYLGANCKSIINIG